MEPLTPLTHVKFTRNREELLEQMHAFEGRRGELFPVKSAAEEAQLTRAQPRGGARRRHPRRTQRDRHASRGLARGPQVGALRQPGSADRAVGCEPELRRACRTCCEAPTAATSRFTRSIRARSAASRFGGDFVLRMLADTTGGRAIVNTNNPDAALDAGHRGRERVLPGRLHADPADRQRRQVPQDQRQGEATRR